MVSPFSLNSPSCKATKNPAESTAGTTATLSVVFSNWPLAAELVAPDRPAHPVAASNAIAVRGARTRVCTRIGVLPSFPKRPPDIRKRKPEHSAFLRFALNGCIKKVKRHFCGKEALLQQSG